MKVLLANPRGFCAGVERAIEIVERALELHGAPIYVRHEVVHNKFVVDSLKTKGAIFVEEIDEVPAGKVVIFSAHGVSKAVRQQANELGAIIYDATCPLVTKVHKEVVRKQKKNHQVILIGHEGHPEVEGTLGQSNQSASVTLIETVADVDKLNLDNKQLSYTTQTTLSIDDTQQIVNALKDRFPEIKSPQKDDICYATQNRQDAVKTLMQDSDMLLVLGSSNSSNSNRLREIAEKMQKNAYLIDGANEIQPSWLTDVNTIGVTAGASAPEILVQEVIDYLRDHGANEVIEVGGVKESTHFPIPEQLRK
ncbi:4-hydroxy-3-methylbut-2-enyl diphosphate reductase (EC 1.17.7.4) [uncultured Gammaproteobacteria bacterium]|jgi:4-hydroxy-3-methylbut-2-enyl diphosphate reductase|uniref:4-hydroxy-3-methylbut-2-enyl diphosphate reductase (EC) n=3 Tax=sulfur-oxidizing symbionts TaxID=32036 RepID=A0ACA8ZQJ1_9GAMM|nr:MULTISPECIES: 4-hydroxy-3-methylbut-2-enyl diphosphate reductase [sulfur-oxidizing symbionts]CAC9499309.1 4-hydroxy-3-methylbut-2-enyl diphosphate reductase (EC 1.17.7.4) [uncultured Gammaproteobacteria bacterium]CAB5501456.1 4-hydroxy-3-methylbut-2-enyl diphosphate reductase (EC [Bathymodiolus thermophilus thioautotrophic gill symbiont]CAB5501531.1 4-hydroxy-3-methylbut-2-enyl diphosphate reductase (EC [Bathymodiolus azoricus thioautotrophic gill symbiont]CAC9503150.1 4-hydroxy-3-methylbut-